MKVTIIVPVYGDWPSLSTCIDSLLQYAENNKVLLVNDCGPEADLIEANIKSKIHGAKNFEYHRNPENLGFLKNCNRAVSELDGTDNDIILLNSDAAITEGLIDTLRHVLISDSSIAAVSPRSNNATITTIPIKAAKHKGLSPQKSYKVFLKIKDKLPEYNTSPVAHGFCMLMRRSVIDKIGMFDEIFGKGYGEEVDFCMRAASHGYKNAISNRAFAYHLEARSFSMDTKKKLIDVNEKVVVERYPTYRRQVRDYRLKAERQEEAVLYPSLVRKFREVASLMKANLRRLVRK